MSGKSYLGDGVYVVDGPFRGAITLTAENGIEATDTIVMEPEVLTALMRYLSLRPSYFSRDASKVGAP